jgi:hypothetical protein
MGLNKFRKESRFKNLWNADTAFKSGLILTQGTFTQGPCQMPILLPKAHAISFEN